MKKLLPILFFIVSVANAQSAKNLPKKPDSVIVAPDTVWIPLTQKQYFLIRQLLEQSEPNLIIQKMDLELRKQAKKKPRP